jgi:hypothetical protein
LPGVTLVRMWEVRGYPRTFDDLLQWVCDVAVPSLEASLNHLGSEVFSSTDQRIVVISRWRNEPLEMPAVPDRLVARSAHAWDFTTVDR